MAEPSQSTKDSLGLDIDSLKIAEDTTATTAEHDAGAENDAPASPAAASPADPAQPADTDPEQPTADEDKKQPPRERKKPYLNHERVKTGGAQREKLSEEALAERMARMREQNEKIKQRRLDVEQDKLEAKKIEEADRAKLAKNKKVQESVDRAREQNARRKLAKIQNREWDSGKPGVKKGAEETPVSPAYAPPAEGANIGIRGAVRGGSGRGRGRGRGRGGPPSAGPAPPEKSDKPVEKSAESPTDKTTDKPTDKTTEPAAPPEVPS